jgi:peptidoglycan/LPS O-acetylase OafA/YrhL
MSDMPPSSDRRIRELDGLRGLAVIMVMAWHFVGCMTEPSQGGWNFALFAGTIFGRTGVDLFFVLSGFLIIGILIDNRNSESLFSTFYARRMARIFPAYFLLIFVYWLCFGVTGSTPAFNASHGWVVQLGTQVCFLYNWLMAYDNGAVSRGFSVTWSVAIEEQFYLIAPFVVWVTPPQYLKRILICGALIAIVLRAGLFAMAPKHTLAPYILPFTRIDCLCAGGLLAIVWRDQRILDRLRPIAVLATLVLIGPVVLMNVCIVKYDLNKHMYFWGHTLLSIFYFFVILTAITRKPGVLRLSIFTGAGSISYALYLFHPLFISLFFTLFRRPEAITNWTDFFIAAGALLASVGFCVLSYRYYETPIRKLGHRKQYSPIFARSPLAHLSWVRRAIP